MTSVGVGELERKLWLVIIIEHSHLIKGLSELNPIFLAGINAPLQIPCVQCAFSFSSSLQQSILSTPKSSHVFSGSEYKIKQLHARIGLDILKVLGSCR